LISGTTPVAVAQPFSNGRKSWGQLERYVALVCSPELGKQTPAIGIQIFANVR